MINSPKITFCSGVSTVTGANFIFESSKGKKIMIDCGLIQGEKVAMEENKKPFVYDLNSFEALVITHAHLDHVGRIPKLVKSGYKGPIYSTPETRELAELVLNDAAGILAEEAKRDGMEPIYDLNDVQAVFPLWKTVKYHEPLQLAEDVSITLKDAGHILGSSMVEITTDNSAKKILFTGDLGNSPAPLLCNTEIIGEIDYLVMESVYGNRNHESREGRAEKFREVILETMNRGGTLVIPTFSIDRTQILLYELNNLVEKNLVPRVPIFVDSPMAIRATEIYAGSKYLFNDKVREQINHGDDIFKFPRLEFTISKNESQDISRMNGAKIILAGSGMSVGGRVISHERHYLPDPKSTILLVGYQAAGSLGRELADGAKKVKIYGDIIKIKARIETLYGYSAHKDSDHLVEFVSTATDKLKKVFVVMGEPGAEMYLAQRINDELVVKAVVPREGETVELG